jgi:hypothetical protein
MATIRRMRAAFAGLDAGDMALDYDKPRSKVKLRRCVGLRV